MTAAALTAVPAEGRGTRPAFAASLVVPVVAVAAAGVPDAFDLPAALLFQDLLYVALAVLGGIAFGAALLASAPAIVLYFVLPIAWSIAGSPAFLEGAARWLDGSRTFSPMLEEALSGTQWARVAATVAVWVLLPLLIGVLRITRREVR